MVTVGTSLRAPLWCVFSILCLIVGAAPYPAGAVVMREGMSDADALRLAERLHAVGRVMPDGSCTLVAPTWVLTAAHVAASIPKDGRVEFDGREYPVRRVVIHPGGVGPEGVPPEVDLALLELAEPVEGIEPVPIYRGSGELGQTILIAGYGDFGTPGKLARSDMKRRAVANVVDDAGPVRLFVVFDAPPAGIAQEGVGGPGDSGGPCLLPVDGKHYLCGVSSASMNGRPGQYGVTDVYTRVSTHVEWIDSIINVH